MQVINWMALSVTEQELYQALQNSPDEHAFLKRLVIALLKQKDTWANRNDCVELFNPAHRYEQGQVIALPYREQGG